MEHLKEIPFLDKYPVFLLSLELPLLQIMQATGLTKEQIDSLKK